MPAVHATQHVERAHRGTPIVTIFVLGHITPLANAIVIGDASLPSLGDEGLLRDARVLGPPKIGIGG